MSIINGCLLLTIIELINVVLNPTIQTTIQNALNDLPTLYKKLVKVYLNDSANNQLVFNVEFNSDLGRLAQFKIVKKVNFA